MTALNSIFATISTSTFRTIAILFIIGMMMTSCQKDAMEDMDTLANTETSEIQAPQASQAPELPENVQVAQRQLSSKSRSSSSVDCCTDLSWIKEARCVSITCCVLNGQTVIDIDRRTCGGADRGGEIYTCDGVFIDFYGGISGKAKPAMNCNNDTSSEDCSVSEDDFDDKPVYTFVDRFQNWTKNPHVPGTAGVTVGNTNRYMNLNNDSGDQQSAVLTTDARGGDTYIAQFDIYVDRSSDARIFFYTDDYKYLSSIILSKSTYKGKWVRVQYIINKSGSGQLIIDGKRLGAVALHNRVGNTIKMSFHTKADGKAYNFWVDNCKIGKEECMYD